MKILWFTNTACSASKIYNPESFNGTWMEALEKELNKNANVKLYIAFYHHKPVKPFNFGDSIYYPVLKKEKLSSKINKRVFGRFNINGLDKHRLIDIINNINPDIIHVHGTETNFGFIQKFISVPVVVSMQGILNPLCEKFFSGVPMDVVKRFKPFKFNLSPFSFIYRFNNYKSAAINEKEILNITKHIIGRTIWDYRLTSVLSKKAKYYHVDEILRENFYNQIWDKDQLATDDLKIITITGNQIYKGFETIIKTALVLQTLTDVKFSWNIIGLNKDDTVVKMIVSWLKVNLSSINIKLHGKLPPDQFIPLMLKSHIYCQASHIENSPNSLCEAMCLGMPVVATFAGGTESMLENNEEGILVQEGDPYSMAGAIIELKNDPEKAKQMAHNARQRALTRHDPDKVVSELLMIYKDIIR